MRASMPSAHSLGVARDRSENHSSADSRSSVCPVLDAASTGPATTSGPCPITSRSNARRAASHAISCSPKTYTERTLRNPLS